jgi:hypothetical protein
VVERAIRVRFPIRQRILDKQSQFPVTLSINLSSLAQVRQFGREFGKIKPAAHISSAGFFGN